MKNTKRKSSKKQKGGFFSIGGRETKSQRELIVKCDLTDVNRINDPFEMKHKLNMCCPTSTFSFFAKNKSTKCNDMKRRYEELLKQNRQNYLKNDLSINNIRDPRELQKMYVASCPRDRFGFKNGSRLCRELDARHRHLSLQYNKEMRQFHSEYSRPNTRRRLSNFGRNMINMFNISTKKNKPPQQLQKKTNNDDDKDNFGIDNIPMTQAEIAATQSQAEPVASSQAEPVAPTQAEPVAPTQAEPVASSQAEPVAPSQAEPVAPTQENKTGGKKIKRKSKKIIKRRKNTKTRRQ